MPRTFYTGWLCENTHITVPAAMLTDLDIDEGGYSWVGTSAWDMCDRCGDCPTDKQRDEMRDDITRQIIWHYWPDVAKEYQREAVAARANPP